MRPQADDRLGQPHATEESGDAVAANSPEIEELVCTDRVCTIFGQVFEASPADRARLLDELSCGDAVLQAQVKSLLDEAEEIDREGFLDARTGTWVSRVLSGDEPEPNPPMPEVIGQYAITGVLGQGGTGIVYRGRSPAPLERDVAIKVMRSAGSPRDARRFMREVSVMASMSHPAVAQVYDSGRLSDGRWWAACALVEGKLITTAALEGRLDWSRRVDLVRQAAEGVHHAHQRGIIHRDLKPSNILVSSDDHGRSRATVIDFGVARLVGAGSARSELTEAGLVVGTLGYMSPEQIDDQDVDARSDVYALGLVLSEVLTGAPARARTSLRQMARAAAAPVDVRLRACGGREHDLEAIMARATDPDPARRYASAQHLADDLERVLTGMPVTARKNNAAYHAQLLARRHPMASLVSLACAALLVILVINIVASRSRLAHEVQDQRELIASLIVETLDRLSVLSGTAESRAAMVELLMERVQRLLPADPDNHDLQAALARLLRERGDLSYHDGDLADAMGEFGRSMALYEALHRRDPRDIELGRRYAESVVRMGDMQRVLFEGQEYLATYDAAMLIQRRLLEMDPSHPGVRDDLCWSYERLRLRYESSHLWPEMEAWLIERLHLAEALLIDTPGRVLSVYNLSSAHYRLANLYRQTRDVASCALHTRAAMELAEQLVHLQPDRSAFVEHLVLVGRNQLRLDTTANRTDQARFQLDDMLERTRQHSRLQPGNAFAEGLLAFTLSLGADMALQWGDTSRACLLASECLEVLAGLDARGINTVENAVSARSMIRKTLTHLAEASKN